MIKKILLGSLLTTLFLTVNAQENSRMTIGLGVGYLKKAYVGDDSNWLAVPHVEYQSGDLYIRGLEAGFIVWKNDDTKLNVHLAYDALQFKPQDSEGALKFLDKRKSTMLIGMGLSHDFGNVTVDAKIAADILGRSDGLIADIGIRNLFMLTPQLSIMPKAGIKWANKKHNKYYYGISSFESVRTGISSYSAGNSFTPYLSIGANYQLTDQLGMYGGAHVEFLSSEVKDSPMVDRSTTSAFSVGLNYTF